MPKPDLKTFLQDPSFAGDRELMSGFIDHHVSERAKQAGEKIAAKKPAENIWDKIFGVGATNNDDVSVFDKIFGGK